MNDALKTALECMLLSPIAYKDWKSWKAEDDQRYAILHDLLWKLVRKDYHGVCDCANDLRELHL